MRFLDVVNLLDFWGEVVGESEAFEFSGRVEDTDCGEGFLNWVRRGWGMEVVDLDLYLGY